MVSVTIMIVNRSHACAPVIRYKHPFICLYCPLHRYRPSAGLFPIVVSQDCGHEATANTINTYGSRITHIKVVNSYVSVFPPSLGVLP